MSFSPSFVVAILMASVAGVAGPSSARAQTAPIKPGLWEVKSSGGGADQSSRAADSLARLPPAQRAQVEAMMKQRGIDMSGGGTTVKICMTRESLDPSQWEHRQNGCRTDYPSRTGALWKFHSVCAQSTTDGEVRFAGPESYTVAATSTFSHGGQTQTRQTSVQAHWLSGDCGDVKPFTPMK